MSSIIKDDSRIRLKTDVDLTQINLSAQEGFLVSRIQGQITVKELYQLSVTDRNATAIMLKRLVDEGILTVESDSPKSSSAGLEILLPRRDYKSFIFNLVDLQEDVELTQAVKKDILFVYDNLNELTYYELFNIPSDANQELIKQTFLRLSKLYHPDNYFRKEIGSYRAKINAIYSALANAHHILMDNVAHSEYRRKLIEEVKIEPGPDDILEDPHDRKRRLEAEAKKSRLMRNPLRAKVEKGREFFDAATKDMERQAWISAANNFKLALVYDPQNELYKHKAEEVKDLANKAAADRVYQRALVLESYGQDGYFESFIRAAKTYPQGAEFNIKVANLYCDQMDFSEALPYAQRAVSADPNNMESRLTLARICLKVKNKEEAVKHLTVILKREPNNEQAKAMLKEAKKWF
jgi:curved DNA-binding protein CbpA